MPDLPTGAGRGVQPLTLDVARDDVRHEVADRQSVGEAAPDEGAGDVDARHVEEAEAPVGTGQAGELHRDVRAGEILTLGHAEQREVEHGLRLAPRGQRVGHVTADDERQLVSRCIRMQRPQGIDRERRPAAPDVDERDAEPRIGGRDRLAHGHAVRDAGFDLHRLVRRHVRRHEQHAVEPELDQRLLRTHEMPEVRRIEGPAEEADARHARAPATA